MAAINFDDDDEMNQPLLESSQIKEYFSGSTILITGVTGFLGKLILEKLMRSFPDLRKIYVLVRPKRGLGVQNRIELLLEDQLFSLVRTVMPNFMEKISVIRGECTRIDLGISKNDKQLLIEEVTCIFHCAGITNLDANLRIASYVNVRATKDLIRLAKLMKNLKSFIHFSSVYAHFPMKSVNEEFYKPYINSQELLTIVEAFDDSALQKLTPIIMGNCKNTFCFTKSITEDLIKTECVGVPVAIVRPSFVIATAVEPTSGWMENLYGPTGLLVSINLGLSRSTLADPNSTVDVVPADYVVNLAIAASCNVANLQALNENKEFLGRRRINEEEIPIYNAVSSPENPLTWERYINLSTKYSSQMPSTLLVSHSSNKINSNRYVHYLYVLFLHYIPAIFVDFATLCVRKPALLTKTYRKIDEFTEDFKYFTLKQWHFKNTNTQELWKKMNAIDRQYFEFDMSSLNWETYYYVYMRGIRIYILKDPLETIIVGAAKYFRLKLMHYVLISVFLILCFNWFVTPFVIKLFFT